QGGDAKMRVEQFAVGVELLDLEVVGDVVEVVELLRYRRVVARDVQAQVSVAELQQGLARLDEAALLHVDLLHYAALDGIQEDAVERLHGAPDGDEVLEGAVLHG